ncbi:MAG: ABC transporter ATP-binding protein [Alicyclobacillaceae bacterium]|nr:ABC transporter ATP-binding protein [Alicyclobacillaceae bacterium]
MSARTENEPANRPPAVRCEGLTKQYGSKRALDGLTLEVPQGRVVGVLGPNGAGKSTLFRVLAGLVQPDAGRVEVAGQLPGWRTNRQIAYLPDRARWYREHTVRDAFRYAEQFLLGFQPEQALELAAWMQLDLDLRAGDMSRGQEARLMLILCIARRVPVILLDEPFAGIDAVSRARITEGLVARIGGGETTVLVSTHELAEVEALFDHAVFLNAGRVLMQGPADELRRRGGSMQEIMQQLYV